MMELTDGLEAGWEEVETDIGGEVMKGFEDNFEHMPFESGLEMDTFNDFGASFEDPGWPEF